MDRDPSSSSDSSAQQTTASDPTIWADYFNLGDGVESNTGNHSKAGNLPAAAAIIAICEVIGHRQS